MQTTITETELLQASLTGSTDAFGQIVARYQSLICAITYSATGDLAKSQELAQETFLRAWKSLSQLRDLSRFRTWLCRIAKNVVNRSIRKRRFDVINQAEQLENAALVTTTGPDPSEQAISREQQEVVWRALENVPEVYRDPMVLFYRRQQSVSQVAKDLDLSESAVKQRLSRGRKLLRTEVASLVEDVLGRTGPTSFFTAAVVAALPGLAPEAAAAGVAAAAAKSSSAAKLAFSTGLAGAIFGPLLGLLGAVFGSWMSIKNTKSARERRFMVRMTMLIWAEMAVLFIVLGLLGVLAYKGVVPRAVFWTTFAVLMTAHFVMLVPTVIWGNRRQRKIQQEDGTFAKPQYTAAKLSKGNMYGSFAGSIFGSVAWIIPVWVITGDWLSALIVAIVAVTIFEISVNLCTGNRSRYWQVVMVDIAALCALNLAVVNLRWNHWTPYFLKNPSAGYLAEVSLWAVNLAFILVFGGLLLAFAGIYRRQTQAAEANGGQ